MRMTKRRKPLILLGFQRFLSSDIFDYFAVISDIAKSLENRHIQRIATAYKNYCNDGDFARIATIQDIADNNFSLSIPLYVKPEVNEDEIDTRTIQEHYDSWRASSEMMKLSYERLNKMLEKEAEENE